MTEDRSLEGSPEAMAAKVGSLDGSPEPTPAAPEALVSPPEFTQTQVLAIRAVEV